VRTHHLTFYTSRVYLDKMPDTGENRREALVKAAGLARVCSGWEYDEVAAASDAAADYLLDFMHHNGDFAIGLLQAASYMLSGANNQENETIDEVNCMTERAISIAPRNPDVLRRAFTIFQRLTNVLIQSGDLIMPDANWETLPQRELLE
jgi:hypothetical protein